VPGRARVCLVVPGCGCTVVCLCLIVTCLYFSLCVCLQVTRNLIQYLQGARLRKNDMRRDKLQEPSPWRFAPRIVTSNKEVDTVNKSQLHRFARDHRKPVYFWQCRPTGTDGDTAICDSTACLADSVRGMTQYFVEGAPCMITKNTYMKHGVANGTTGTMHSLTWDDPSDKPVIPENYLPGQLIRVRQPYSVNVLLPVLPCKHVKKDSTTNMKIVPIIRTSYKFTVVKYNRKTKQRGRGLKCYTHNVTPTFAVTFHKAQGQTLDHVILHLHKHPGRSLKCLQFQGLYVALSRVECGSRLRVVFGDRGGLKHLYKLKRPKNFDLWINNYCKKTGKWKHQGMENLRQSELKAARQKLKRTDDLNALNKVELTNLTRVIDVEVQKSVKGFLNKQQYVNALYDVWIKERNSQKSRRQRKSDDPLPKRKTKPRPLPKRRTYSMSTASVSETCNPKKRTRRNSDKNNMASALLPNTYDMRIQWQYLEQIKAGLKTVEGRPNFDDLGEIRSGDILHFKVCVFAGRYDKCCYILLFLYMPARSRQVLVDCLCDYAGVCLCVCVCVYPSIFRCLPISAHVCPSLCCLSHCLVRCEVVWILCECL
jgi:hypothetical protein